MSERTPSLFVVSAPSGVGKSTVLARLLHELTGIRFSVSHTTRPPRDGELDGVQYHFVSRETFEELIRGGMFLEWAEVHDHLYGTSRAEYERAQSEGVDLLLDLDVQGARHLRRHFPEAVMVFLLPPSFEDLERRIRGRGQDDDRAIRRRLEVAHQEIVAYREYDYVVVNEDLDDCVGDVRSVIRAVRCRADRMEPRGAAILKTFDLNRTSKE